MSKDQPTPRQLQLLRAIAEFQAKHCYSPTIAELAIQLSVTRSTTFEHIAELQKKQFLSTSPTKARSLELTLKSRKLLKRFSQARHLAPCGDSTDTIPLLGRVAAGQPIEAIQDDQTLSLAGQFSADSQTFALRVKGQSMIDDGIYDGDYVICRKSAIASNGQLVIAIVDDQNATLKRFYKEKDRVRLQPANDNYQPIYSDNCRIEAVVTGLIRKFK